MGEKLKKPSAYIAILILIVMMLLFICFYLSNQKGNFRAERLKEINSRNQYKMSYANFEGTKFRKINLKEGQELDFNVKTKTYDGDLTITLLDKNNNEVFKMDTFNDKESNKVKVNENSQYKIKAEGKHHGGFEVTWNTVQ